MRASSILALTALVIPGYSRVLDSPYVGYLISTFSDPNPQVQWHLSKKDDPKSFNFLNNGNAVLESTVGTKGVRDIYLTHNSERSEYFIIATGAYSTRDVCEDCSNKWIDLDVNADGFNWDVATRHGSRGLVIWNSTNLVDWSKPSLRT